MLPHNLKCQALGSMYLDHSEAVYHGCGIIYLDCLPHGEEWEVLLTFSGTAH